MSEQQLTLSQQLTRVEIAGELLEKAPMHKTKKAAQFLGKETMVLLGQVVEVVNQQSIDITKIQEGLS